MGLMGKGMAMFFLVFALTFALMKSSSGEVYKVGDAAGWTISNEVNYTQWANSRSFHHGDTIVFEYNKKSHNVVQVSRENYHKCNTSSPYATYNSGNDTIFVTKRKGHYFFICGVPGHCEAGQKVDIRIPPTNANTNTMPPSTWRPSSQAPAPAPISSSSRGYASKGYGVALSVVVAGLFMLA